MSEEENEARLNAAKDIVKRNLKWSAGAGIIPILGLDSIAVGGAQLKMLKELANHYDIEFKKDLVKHLLASFMGGVGASALAYGGVGQVLKAVPGIGTIFGMVAMPAASVATSYAVGNTFIKHFETGGNFLNFNISGTREYFQKELTKGLDSQQQVSTSPEQATA